MTISALADGLLVVSIVRRFLFQTIHDVALMLDQERVDASYNRGVVGSNRSKLRLKQGDTTRHIALQAPHRGRHRRPP